MGALIRAASLTNYVEVARRAGLNPARMLKGAGLSQAALNNPDLRLPAEQVGSLLERSARESGCPTIGLQMAESRRISDFGALSLLLTHQRTMRDVLSTTIEHLHVLNESLAVQMEDAGDLVLVREEIVGSHGGSTRQGTELAVGVLFRMFRTVLGQNWKPDSVNFVHAGPPDLAVHRRVFGMKVTFNSEFSGMVCEARDLDRPNPSADPVMARYAKQFVDAMPGARTRTIAQEVRKAIYLLLPLGRATLEQVASGLGMNARTLQRHLDDSKTDFSSELDSVRRDLVVRYLKNSAHSLTEIGQMLGFSHSSAFSRWYSAQFGLPPTRARKRKA
jgi:AraC-like DNA-binding protein